MNNGEKEIVHRILVIDDNPNIHEDFKTILLKEQPNKELDSLETEVLGHSARKSTPKNNYELDFTSQGKEGHEKILGRYNPAPRKVAKPPDSQKALRQHRGHPTRRRPDRKMDIS